MLHGDAKLENLGLRGDRLVAIDWGEWTGTGPAEMDVAWFSAMSTMPIPGAPTWRLDVLPGHLLAAYDAHAARPLDPRTVDLAYIGMLAEVGCGLADYAVLAKPDNPARPRASLLLDRWIACVRSALETWSPV